MRCPRPEGPTNRVNPWPDPDQDPDPDPQVAVHCRVGVGQLMVPQDGAVAAAAPLQGWCRQWCPDKGPHHNLLGTHPGILQATACPSHLTRTEAWP